VGVVGSGGAAHVLQQLAYLGVGRITAVDADRVDITSLNRLIGALPPRRRTLLAPAVELMMREPGRPRAGSPDSNEDVSLARTEPLSTTDILAGHFVVACQPCVAYQGCR